MAKDEQQLELPFNTGERVPPKAAARRSAKEVQAAVKALRAAKVRKEQSEEYARQRAAQDND